MGFIGVRSQIATILINTSLSDAVELRGADVIRITIPDAWDAADITFQVDDGDGTFRDLWMEWGWELAIWVVAGTSIECSVFLRLQQIHRIKIRSGTSGAPVNQTAEREVVLEVGVKG